MDKILDISFDDRFAKIEGLASFPWVGQGYHNAPVKVLLIGENQYAVDADGEMDEDTHKWFLEDRDATRGFVHGTTILNSWSARFYVSLLKTFGVEEDARAEFWDKVAFYNFFQNPDGAISNNNHDTQERIACWECWHKIVEILQPQVCIFFAKSTYKFFDQWNRQKGHEGWSWEDILVDELERDAIKAHFDLSPEYRIKIWFVYHPARTSSVAWNAFLTRVEPDAMKFLAP